MAARKRKGLSENTRDRIQASMLVNRLTDHALGKCEMSATQVNATRILLSKSLPDLQSIQLAGEGGGPVQIIVHANDSKVL
jgi:hypothetical protein